ncbi:MAG: prepilin-type N-terminal cleavage/methylation domain-containing protein [Actinomycetota bacterium]|nr:prepilin-type N-terminal cleavage/methylation domain-containing protein [Actinomycetota bacterium]
MGKIIDKENGFTIVELLVTSLIITVAVTLGASAIRHYWRLQALRGSVEQVVSEMRGHQQEATSESHPYVWGTWFKSGSNRWGVVRGNIKTGTCEVRSRRTFGGGVAIQSASFADIDTLSLSANCAAATESGAEIALFLARGTATGGSVNLTQADVSGGAPRTISVSPITGRVTQP